MKTRSYLFLLLVVLSVSSYGQRVVALHGVSGIEYFNGVSPFVDAYNAASIGDTIYLPGGAFTPPAEINKGLIIYGVGYHPDSTAATSPTLISGSLLLKEDADNFYMEGVEVSIQLNFAGNESVSQFTFRRCRIDNSVNITGNLTNPSTQGAFIECVFMGSINIQNLTNSLFSNCISQGSFINSNSNQFKNLILLVSNVPYYDRVFNSCNNNEISNCIVMNTTNYFINGTGNICYNNLFVAASPDFSASAITNGNYFSVDPATIFVNQSGNAFTYDQDYHLQTPETYPGTDGSEVGIYGGIFPFKPGSVPITPHISMKEVSPVTDPDGNLNVTIQVSAQQN